MSTDSDISIMFKNNVDDRSERDQNPFRFALSLNVPKSQSPTVHLITW